MHVTSTRAIRPPSTAPDTRSMGDCALAQPIATAMVIATATASGATPTAPDRAETGSAAPAVTLTAASAAKATACVADRW